MGPKKWSQGYKKNSAVSWALYVVPLLRVLPTYFDAKDEFFFFHFLHQARLGASFLVQLKGIFRIGLRCSKKPCQAFEKF